MVNDSLDIIMLANPVLTFPHYIVNVQSLERGGFGIFAFKYAAMIKEDKSCQTYFRKHDYPILTLRTYSLVHYYKVQSSLNSFYMCTISKIFFTYSTGLFS